MQNEPDDLNDHMPDGLELVPYPSFLSTLQPAAGNVCPAGGEHESASHFSIMWVSESTEPHEAHVYCCRKCSSLYWLRKDINQSSSTNSHP